MPSCIEYQQVSKSYDSKPVLSDFSLSIAAGITTAIVGESGSGKSTLLKLANGLVFPDQGQVSVFEKPVETEKIHEMRLGMGYSVQGGGLFPHLTVFENATLMARLQNWQQTAIEERYRQVMELLGLTADLDDRYPFALSGGQQQRVSLCRSLMLNPPLLLLDEPFSALDPLTRDAIHAEFKIMQRVESRSIVLVTHDMGEAIDLADEVIVLLEGKVEQHAAADKIVNNPATAYVSDLLGVHIT